VSKTASQNVYRIEVAIDERYYDAGGEAAAAHLRAAGLAGVRGVREVRVYNAAGAISRRGADTLARKLLADPVVDRYSIGKPVLREARRKAVEVFRRPGVMDPAQASVKKGARELGLELAWVRTARRFVIEGAVSAEDLKRAAPRVLANEVIEEITLGRPDPHLPASPPYRFKKIILPIRGMDDAALLKTSRDGGLSLSLVEMKTIRAHFVQKGRDPTDVELETIAQTWSEHCGHKTLKGRTRYRGPDGEAYFENLLKETIARATAEIDAPWCLSVFKDNAGIISFDDEYAVTFKVETHNHPSAIEPYGGAGTGLGGVIRDTLGTGLGAKPIANTDIFCFAPPDTALDKLPPGALPPKRVMEGVVSGVRDYGNRMGIPTVNGAVYFDERYLGNPLVYCGSVGMIPRKAIEKASRPGDLVLMIGGRVGRDGIHGATFSSVELTEDSETVSSGAVQIGNAIEEKKFLDALMAARDRGLFSCVTDCGAGGLSSAVGEMGEHLGADVDLDKVPLKYEGLSYSEIWISEAQERMVLAVPPEKLDEIMALFAGEDIDATVIGRFTNDRILRLHYRGEEVAALDMEFLHNGTPRVERQAVWKPKKRAEPDSAQFEKMDLNKALLAILGSWNVCSKEWIIRQYDHEVQGAGAIKPLVGVAQDGPGDAAVIAPRYGSTRGVVLSCGMNPRQSDIDPYHMAAGAIDEAVRNAVAVGADPDRIAILDNFCWGNTDKPDRLGALVRASRACFDVATAYGTPFISGKDSLNNEFAFGGEVIVIPHTLLISAIGVIDDVRKCATMDLKEAGNNLVLAGLTRDELGASHLYMLKDEIGANVPKVDVDANKKTFAAVHACIRKGLARACHDLSEGGLAAAAAEMAFAGGLGAEIDAEKIPTDGELPVWKRLFSETHGRFLIETADPAAVIKAFDKAGAAASVVGVVTNGDRVRIRGSKGKGIDARIGDLKAAWKKPLAW
jgi:phosphoribosylformylglycinamidine synthase subunit PurSL